jgi:hypothetical protein
MKNKINREENLSGIEKVWREYFTTQHETQGTFKN